MSPLVRRIVASMLVLSIVLPASGSAQHATDCSGYDAWIWAQAVYDSDPASYAGLDPDGDGIACNQLSVYGFSPAIWADGIPQGSTAATITGVVDGDTISVALADGSTDTVRLLHMDTPETSGTVGQCGGTEATEYLNWILGFADGGTVYLESDETARDRYDRRLAYVWFWVAGDSNPYMANYSMILAGWAESETYEPDVKHKEQLDAAEKFSIDHVLGVRLQCGKFGRPADDASPSNEQVRQAWNNQPNQGQLPAFPGSGQNTSSSNAAAAPAPTAAPVVQQATDDCDPSYPTVCIPPKWKVGDLDCGDISPRRFQVIPPDPHNFDGDFDGVGCEGG